MHSATRYSPRLTAPSTPTIRQSESAPEAAAQSRLATKICEYMCVSAFRPIKAALTKCDALQTAQGDVDGLFLALARDLDVACNYAFLASWSLYAQLGLCFEAHDDSLKALLRAVAHGADTHGCPILAAVQDHSNRDSNVLTTH